MGNPVEVTTRYVTSVDDLHDAWNFVMQYVDLVGPDPEVHIKPVWIGSVADMERDSDAPWPRRFEVVVEGMVEEGKMNG